MPVIFPSYRVEEEAPRGAGQISQKIFGKPVDIMKRKECFRGRSSPQEGTSSSSPRDFPLPQPNLLNRDSDVSRIDAECLVCEV